PPLNSSTLSTAAPSSAKISVAYGPGSSLDRSSTLMSLKGKFIAAGIFQPQAARQQRREGSLLLAPTAGLSGEQLAELHRQAHVHRLELELALHRRHLSIELFLADLHEVLVADGDRHLRGTLCPAAHPIGVLSQVHRPSAALLAGDVEVDDRV